MDEPSPPRTRLVVEAEALAWLAEHPALAEAAGVVTSLPDVSEVELDLEAWRAWFVDAARHVVRWVGPGVAIFYQSDIRTNGAVIDKSYLVMRAVEEEGAALLWHKIVCRRPPGTVAFDRPSYSHMMAIAKEPRRTPRSPGPDVMDGGAMSWSRAMGENACREACRYLRDEVGARVVVDPFCGRGTVLAIANAMGMDAIGIDLSKKRCRAARAAQVGSAISTTTGA